MKRLLLLQLRPEDEVADNEYESVVAAGVPAGRIRRVRMEQDGLPAVNLDDYAAVIVGGGPSNASNPPEKQPAYQREFEPKLYELLAEIVKRDMPYLGICYGLGALTVQQGGVVSKKYAEAVGGVEVSLTVPARTDDLFAGVESPFMAYVGHKEAVEVAPSNATILATSAACPVQMYRIGRNVYAAQFHPELDLDSLALRIRAYKHLGYFAPEEAENLIDEARRHDVGQANVILEQFVARYLA